MSNCPRPDRGIVSALALTALVCVSLPAAPQVPRPMAAMAQAVGDPPASTADAAQEFEQLKVPGRQVRAGVKRAVAALEWHRELEAAQRDAELQNKPIVWVQALGELRGLT